MRHISGRLLIGTAVAGLACLVWQRSPAAGEPAADAPAAPAAETLAWDHGWNESADKSATWMGVASCASSSCHHEGGPKGSLRSEYDTWVAYDKHARAFVVLYNERSERIVRNLYGDKAKPATEQPLCLKCHASHDGVTDKGASDRFQLADGVGCESCHGAAEKWLTAHYQAGFKEMSLEGKAALGMRPTKDILHRAELCATCHVGTPDKEVNHDLIAAGHPRLAFELGAYHGIANKHWDVNKDIERYPDFQSRLWTVGQYISAKAALDLLASRAEAATKAGAASKPWPEFSEYNCFACHKQLEVNSPRQTAGYLDRRAGSLPWGDWYLSDSNPLSKEIWMRPAEDDQALEKLKKLMQAPAPDATKVARSARDYSRHIADVVTKMQPNRNTKVLQTQTTLDRLVQLGREKAKGMSWDQAAQLYLALAAMQNELSDLERNGAGASAQERLASVKGRLEAMAKDLQKAFPKGSDSPSQFSPTTLESDLATIRENAGK